MKIVPSKRQVPKPIKLLEGIGNAGNGALIPVSYTHLTLPTNREV